VTYPNQDQAAVLGHLHGTLLVLAPAGTGKTRLMADRLAAVITAGMSPEHTLGVTFTNRAAEHMRAAVQHSCGTAAKQCRIHTFHGLCAWILRTAFRTYHAQLSIWQEIRCLNHRFDPLLKKRRTS
jgi:DNA helicase-2/ATP-dependent DNA helicase PcrA